MDWLTATLLIITLVLWFSTRRPKNFPPGLRRIPIIGHIMTGSKPTLSLKYPNIVGIFVANYPTVMIQNFKLAKDLLNREEWCGRHSNIISQYLRSDSGKNKGIISTDGHEWSEQRRFALKHLKDFGFGKVGLHGVIQEEVDDLIIHLSKFEHEDFRMETVFGIPVINVLWTIVAGKRFDRDDAKVQRMMKLLNRLFKGMFQLEYIFPWWGLICYYVPGLQTRKNIISELRTMFRESIEEHRKTIDITQPRDFMDTYLTEIASGTNPNFDQESLELCCLDLFKAGAETSSTTLLWCLLYLVKYPEVQENCFKEVMSVTGDVKPSRHHDLPYCQAVIQEVQRLACVAPQTMPHRVTKDVKVEGYNVPKDAMALTNLSSFMSDPKYWKEPVEFRPERFLERVDVDTKLVKKEMFVPYGMGRRICMGESLAKDTLFIFFTNLVKSLKFTNPASYPAPNPASYTEGFTIIPKPYYVNIECRN